MRNAVAVHALLGKHTARSNTEWWDLQLFCNACGPMRAIPKMPCPLQSVPQQACKASPELVWAQASPAM